MQVDSINQDEKASNLDVNHSTFLRAQLDVYLSVGQHFTIQRKCEREVSLDCRSIVSFEWCDAEFIHLIDCDEREVDNEAHYMIW